MIYTKQIKKAIKIAFDAHEKQKDKAGLPYILHPIHLAEQMDTEEEIIVAFLHDVVEDSSYTFEDLESFGFSKEVMDALKLLTHAESIPYRKYIEEIKTNPLARKVKLADLAHNSEISRIENPTQKDYERIQKYAEAIQVLQGEKEV
ncbi:MAG: GTP pyrophosphokinase [Solobacterium sp.]|nr:GTP pyrophosphokinase [Solobacterium sp.]